MKMLRKDFIFNPEKVITTDRFLDAFPTLYHKTDFLFSSGVWRDTIVPSYNGESSVIVVGHSDYEVNDFHILTKDYIYTLNVSATRELHRKMLEQERRIKELEDRLAVAIAMR
jgi:hypothetical protein